MAAFQLSLPGFDGPVGSLPPLVSSHKLALDEIALAEIPAQFLAETQRREVIDLELAGEIAATTARLLLMKSSQLLLEPADEEEEGFERGRDDGTRDLFREAALRLSHEQGTELFPSTGRLDLIPRRLEPRPAGLLAESWQAMIKRMGVEAVRTAVPSFLRLETAISGLISRLRGGRAVALQHMFAGRGRRDVVIHFLAALELVRRGRASADQGELFGEITLGWLEGERDDIRERAV
jgi:segregation and condensation protein A